MGWNYRIIDHGGWRGLHEVYYDARNRPQSYTENTTFVEDSEESDGISSGLEMALRDIREMPILPVSAFRRRR